LYFFSEQSNVLTVTKIVWRFFMKMTKTAVLLAVGFIAVLLFAGCFSLVGGNGDTNSGGQDSDGPFTMSVTYGDVAESLNAKDAVPTGPTVANIKSGLYNYIQLVVVDSMGKVSAFKDDRQANSSVPNTTFSLPQLDPGKTSFLLLMGYWDRDVDKESKTDNVTTYAYKENVTPVLLASGYQEITVKEGQGGQVTITMWPIVTYADFTHTPPPSSNVLQKFESGTPPQLLPGVDWNVQWRITRNAGKDNGLGPLLEAQNAINAESPMLNIVAKSTIADKAVTSLEETTTSNTISFDGPSNEVRHIGEPHSVNFRLTYVPFNITDSSQWGKSKSIVLGGSYLTAPPKWFIMNGLNLEPRDANTTYNRDTLGEKGKNGNGSVLATVIAEPGYPSGGGDDDGKKEPGPNPPSTIDDDKPGSPEDPDNPPRKPDIPGGVSTDDLILYDGKFYGPQSNGSSFAAISFRTWGYSGEVKISYAVVRAAEGYGLDENNDKYIDAGKALPYEKFTESFPTLRAVGGPYGEVVKISDAWAANWEDESLQIWLVFTYNGKVSNRLMIAIDKKNKTDGDYGVDWQWGE
jgi:hypothetical protein